MANISGDDSVERGARPGKSQSCEVGGGRTAFGMCLNWRVLGGLALVALVVLVAAPSLAVRALPLLLVAVCPLSMVAMMWAMRGNKAGPSVGAAEPTVPSVPESVSDPEPTLSDLHSELADVHAHQERLARKILELEASATRDSAAPAPGPGVRSTQSG
jgi:hypothetical protein